MKYRIAWTQKDGTEIKNQIFTAENISGHLKNLEEWGATNIKIESFEEKKAYNEYDIANLVMEFYNPNDSLDTLKEIIVKAIELADLKFTDDLFRRVFDEILYRLA